MSGASSSTDPSRGARIMRGAGIVALVLLHAVGAWSLVVAARRERALERPRAAADLLRLRPDALGPVDVHGDHGFMLLGQQGPLFVRVGRDTMVLTATGRGDLAALDPGTVVAVWGRQRPGELAARAIAVWPAPPPS
jgi:hypothetical protein